MLVYQRSWRTALPRLVLGVLVSSFASTYLVGLLANWVGFRSPLVELLTIGIGIAIFVGLFLKPGCNREFRRDLREALRPSAS